MTKIKCSRFDCKYNSDKNECRLKRISLTFHSIQTVYDGRANVLVCNQYELDELAKQIMEELKKMR